MAHEILLPHSAYLPTKFNLPTYSGIEQLGYHFLINYSVLDIQSLEMHA